MVDHAHAIVRVVLVVPDGAVPLIVVLFMPLIGRSWRLLQIKFKLVGILRVLYPLRILFVSWELQLVVINLLLNYGSVNADFWLVLLQLHKVCRRETGGIIHVKSDLFDILRD